MAGPFRDPFRLPVRAEPPGGSPLDLAIRSILPASLASSPLDGLLISARTTGPAAVIGAKVGPPCARCGTRVWLAPSSQRYGGPIPAVLCIECVAAALDRFDRKADA